MPLISLRTSSYPTVSRAYQAPETSPTFPPWVNLWYEGGVLWGINTTNPLDSLPLAFHSAGAFRQCMKINTPHAHDLKFGTGTGPYGNSFHVAHWSVTTPIKRRCAWIATSLSSPSIINAFLVSSGWYCGQLIFPAPCFVSVTANSPSGNVTIPHLPLILVSSYPPFKTAVGGGNYPAYFARNI